MRIILAPLVLLMVPIAFIVLAYDIAKAFVEEKIETELRSENES
jgi:hypothetical protein